MLIPNAPAVNEMSEGLKTIPEGTYNFRIQKSEYVATPKSKDAKGPYLKISCVVTGPGDVPQLGQYVFSNLTLTGDGTFRLRELLTVTGHPEDFRLTDSDQLLNLEFAAATIIQPGKDGYADKNEFKKYLPVL